MSDRVILFMDAVKGNNAVAVRQLLSAHGVELKPALEATIPGWMFGETPLIAAVRARSRDMIDALLGAGADINGRTRWWAGGFGVFDETAGDPDLAEYLVERGAFVDVHAAARLGKLDHLRMLLSASPALISARGGDGMLPLHFSSSVEIASYLVSQGADINARDIDHESTAAQYMVRDRQEIVRYLVSLGCESDLLLAAAIGDPGLVERHIGSIRMCVSPKWFPMSDHRAGGSIYTWTLGPLKTAHQVAHEFGHTAVFDLLMARSPLGLRLAVECELGLTPTSSVVDSEDEVRLVNAAKANDPDKVRRMLEHGWPVGAVDPGGATALHFAAFHGSAALVSLLLERGARVDVEDSVHGGTPLGWASYGSTNSWLHTSGDYPAVVALLVGASPGRLQ